MKPAPFEQLLREHASVVMAVCRALLPPADADDAWSETFLAALEAYPHLEDATNLRGWLVTIAHRKAIDQIRRRARNAVPMARLPERITHEDRLDDGDELARALNGLPYKQRCAVAYHYLGGLRYAEVGRLIDSSEAAARRSAADGIASLRRTYAMHEEEGS